VRKIVSILFLTAALSATAQSNSGLCDTTEKLLFGFETKAGKTLLICLATDSSYIVYRYGAKGKVELEYPADKRVKPNDAFKYRWYSRGGGAANLAMHDGSLSFEINEIRYEVFDSWSSEDNARSVGVKVINLKTKKETVIKGVKPVGGLISLQDFLENPF
jgi:hypothetical protein